MKSIFVAMLLGFPLIVLLMAMGLMVWRAFNPRRNSIRGLTDAKGVIVNPYIHAAVGVLCLVLATYAFWRLSVLIPHSKTAAGRLGEHLDLWIPALVGTALSAKFFRQYRLLRKQGARPNA